MLDTRACLAAFRTNSFVGTEGESFSFQSSARSFSFVRLFENTDVIVFVFVFVLVLVLVLFCALT